MSHVQLNNFNFRLVADCACGHSFSPGTWVGLKPLTGSEDRTCYCGRRVTPFPKSLPPRDEKRIADAECDSDGAREGNDGWATARVPRERFP